MFLDKLDYWLSEYDKLLYILTTVFTIYSIFEQSISFSGNLYNFWIIHQFVEQSISFSHNLQYFRTICIIFRQSISFSDNPQFFLDKLHFSWTMYSIFRQSRAYLHLFYLQSTPFSNNLQYFQI